MLYNNILAQYIYIMLKLFVLSKLDETINETLWY